MHPLIADVVVDHLKVTADYANNYIEHITNSIWYDNTDPSHNLFDKKKYEPLAERLVYLFFNNTTGATLITVYNYAGSKIKMQQATIGVNSIDFSKLTAGIYAVGLENKAAIFFR